MRLLLKQDEISMLEEALDRIDKDEEREMFLGCSRSDTNTTRRQTLLDLKRSLAEHGNIERDLGSINTGKQARLTRDDQMRCWSRISGH